MMSNHLSVLRRWCCIDDDVFTLALLVQHSEHPNAHHRTRASRGQDIQDHTNVMVFCQVPVDELLQSSKRIRKWLYRIAIFMADRSDQEFVEQGRIGKFK